MNSISIYIPRVSVDCDEAFFRQFFHMICFGCVDRVDFVALDYDYTSNGRFRKAFVHFNLVYNTQIADDIVTTLSKGEPYRLYPRAGEHWLLLKNKVPVLATTMNIHQLAENYRLLEEKTRGLEKKTSDLEEKVRDLEEKSKRLDETVAKQDDILDRAQQNIYELEDVARHLVEKARDLEEKSKGFEETMAKQDDMLDRSQQTIYQMIPLLNMSKCDERVFTRVLLGLKKDDEQEDDDFDFLGEDIDDNMMSFCMLEKKYGTLTFNKKTNDFTDGDGFVRYVLSKTEMLDEVLDEIKQNEVKEEDEEPQRDLFGTEPFLKYADFCRMRNERNESEENNLKMD
jgi:hypothetical protein